MLTLITLLLVGLGIAYFANQNTQGVTLTLANYPLTDIPLYIIALISMILGIGLSWILSLPGTLSALFEMKGKENTIQKAHHSIDSLNDHIRKLELENARLKGDARVERVEEERTIRDEQEEYRPSLLTRVRQSFR